MAHRTLAGGGDLWNVDVFVIVFLDVRLAPLPRRTCSLLVRPGSAARPGGTRRAMSAPRFVVIIAAIVVDDGGLGGRLLAPKLHRWRSGRHGVASHLERHRRFVGIRRVVERHVLVAQRHHQLRDLLLRVDFHGDVFDMGDAPLSLGNVLEFDVTTNAQELQVRTDQHLATRGVTHPRAHRRSQPLNVQTDTRPRHGAVRVDQFGFRRCHAGRTQRVQQVGAALVESGETHPKLATAAFIAAPDDLAFGHDFPA